MYLATTSQKLQAVLGAAKTTTDGTVVVQYSQSGGQPPSPYAIATNGVTAVDICPAPTQANQVRTINELTYYNGDTVAQAITINLVDGSTSYPLYVGTVAVGQTLFYVNGLWSVTSGTPSGRLVTLASQGTLLNTYTTAKSILPAAAVTTVGANFFTVGKQLRIRCSGGLSNIVTTPGTITFQVMIGSVIAFTSGAIQLNATAHTLLPFYLEILMTLRAAGSGTTAKFQGNGTLQGIMFTLTAAQTDAANTGGVFSIPATAPALGTGFDSTASQAIDLWAGFSISNSGNGIQAEQFTIDVG